jgi:hypothetical protein
MPGTAAFIGKTSAQVIKRLPARPLDRRLGLTIGIAADPSIEIEP